MHRGGHGRIPRDPPSARHWYHTWTGKASVLTNFAISAITRRYQYSRSDGSFVGLGLTYIGSVSLVAHVVLMRLAWWNMYLSLHCQHAIQLNRKTVYSVFLRFYTRSCSPGSLSLRCNRAHATFAIDLLRVHGLLLSYTNSWCNVQGPRMCAVLDLISNLRPERMWRVVVRSSVRNSASSGPIVGSEDATSLKLCVLPVGQSEHVPCSNQTQGTHRSRLSVSS